LREEGFVREIVSKIQTMRKEAGFEVMDKISVYFAGSAKVCDIFTRNCATISGEVLAASITEDANGEYVKEWNINGETVTLGVTRLSGTLQNQ
jgi:isoleucyl-tRNA synthetase